MPSRLSAASANRAHNTGRLSSPVAGGVPGTGVGDGVTLGVAVGLGLGVAVGEASYTLRKTSFGSPCAVAVTEE